MIISEMFNGSSLYMNDRFVGGYAFENAAVWVKDILLPVICAIFGLVRDYCAHFRRIECLLPTIRPV